VTPPDQLQVHLILAIGPDVNKILSVFQELIVIVVIVVPVLLLQLVSLVSVVIEVMGEAV
jgi:hypothetical protein